MIKAVIFDYDGTLGNRQLNAYQVFDYYLRDIFKDLDELEFEAILQDLMTDDCNGTINCKYRLAPFINKYKDKLPENFEEEFTKFYYDHMGDFAVLKQDTIDVVNKIKENYKVAVLSNGISSSQRNKFNHVGLSDLFDEIIVSEEINVKKPNKEAFEIIADRLNVKCEECVYVGDVFSSDIIGAIRAKMVPVWILEDTERPAKYYKGYRIEKLTQLFDVLEKEKNK